METHSVQLLEEALELAAGSGLEIRQEWMDDRGGGVCRVGERRILFIDISQSVQEQLSTVLTALRDIPLPNKKVALSAGLRNLLDGPVEGEVQQAG